MADTNLDWKGQALAYKRTKGFGLVLRKFHYRFGEAGEIEEVGPVNRTLLEYLVKELYPDSWQITLAAGLGKKEVKKDE